MVSYFPGAISRLVFPHPGISQATLFGFSQWNFARIRSRHITLYDTKIFVRIHLDSHNSVNKNLCENGFSNSCRISDPVQTECVITH